MVRLGGWDVSVLTKAMSDSLGNNMALSVQDANIPMVEGVYLLPPFISRNGVSYSLRRQDRSESYTNPIRVNPDNISNYSYVITAEGAGGGGGGGQAAAPVEGGGPSLSDLRGSDPSELANQLAKAGRAVKDLGEGEGSPSSVLDSEPTAEDGVVNKWLKIFFDATSPTEKTKHKYAARLVDYLEFVRAREQKSKSGEWVKPHSAKAAESALELMRRDFLTLNDLETLSKLLASAGKDSFFSSASQSLPLTHLQALLDFKVGLAKGSVTSAAMESLRAVIGSTQAALETNAFVVNIEATDYRSDARQAFVALMKSVIVSPILNKTLGTIIMQDDGSPPFGPADLSVHKFLDFAGLPGFSKEAIWVLKSFFADNTEKPRLYVDGEVVRSSDKEFLDGRWLAGQDVSQVVIEFSPTKVMTINFSSFVNGSSVPARISALFRSKQTAPGTTRPDLVDGSEPEAPVVNSPRASRSLGLTKDNVQLWTQYRLESLFMSNYLQLPSIMGVTAGHVDAVEAGSFIVVKDGKATKRLTFSSQTNPVWNQRGALGQVGIGLLHLSDEENPFKSVRRTVQETLESLITKSSEMQSYIRELVLGVAEHGAKYDGLVGGVAVAKAALSVGFAMNVASSLGSDAVTPQDIGFFAIVENGIRVPTAEISEEDQMIMMRQYFDAYGYIPATYTGALAAEQTRLLRYVASLRRGNNLLRGTRIESVGMKGAWVTAQEEVVTGFVADNLNLVTDKEHGWGSAFGQLVSQVKEVFSGVRRKAKNGRDVESLWDASLLDKRVRAVRENLRDVASTAATPMTSTWASFIGDPSFSTDKLAASLVKQLYKGTSSIANTTTLFEKYAAFLYVTQFLSNAALPGSAASLFLVDDEGQVVRPTDYFQQFTPDAKYDALVSLLVETTVAPKLRRRKAAEAAAKGKPEANLRILVSKAVGGTTGGRKFFVVNARRGLGDSSGMADYIINEFIREGNEGEDNKVVARSHVMEAKFIRTGANFSIPHINNAGPAARILGADLIRYGELFGLKPDKVKVVEIQRGVYLTVGATTGGAARAKGGMRGYIVRDVEDSDLTNEYLEFTQATPRRLSLLRRAKNPRMRGNVIELESTLTFSGDHAMNVLSTSPTTFPLSSVSKSMKADTDIGIEYGRRVAELMLSKGEVTKSVAASTVMELLQNREWGAAAVIGFLGAITPEGETPRV